MELIDGAQFPCIERVLQLKAKLLRDLKHDREVSCGTSVDETAQNNIASVNNTSNWSDGPRSNSSSVNISEVSASSMKELLRKSLEAPTLTPSAFDGLATRARALMYHCNGRDIIDRVANVAMDNRTVRKRRSQRLSSPEVEEVVIRGPDHYHNLALSVFTNKKQSQLSKKQRLNLVRRLGKGRLAEIHRAHFLKRACFAAIIMSFTDKLALESSDSQDMHEESLVGILCAAEGPQVTVQEEEWETLYDAEHDAYYHYNSVTGDSQWRTEPAWQ